MQMAVWQLRTAKDDLCESIRHMHGSLPHPGLQILQLRALKAAHSLLHRRAHCLQILARHQPARNHSLCQHQQYNPTLRSALSSGGARASAVDSSLHASVAKVCMQGVMSCAMTCVCVCIANTEHCLMGWKVKISQAAVLSFMMG